jgi:hypothetical protein
MAKSSTNKFALSICKETSLGVADTTWFQLEPNNVTQFGSQIKQVARRPISKLRQYRKGATVDVDSIVEYDFDLTMDALGLIADPMLYSESGNSNLYFRAANVDASGYVISAATASQAGKIQWVTGAGNKRSLFYAAGYLNAGNNGLKAVTADTTPGDGHVFVSGLTTETAPNNAVVTLAGYRSKTSDLSYTSTGATTGTLHTAGDVNFTTIGISVGQFVNIGGLLTANQFAGGGGTGGGVSMGRATLITSTDILFDKLIGTLITSNGTGDTVDLLFGRFARNVSIDDNADDKRYLENSYQFEGAYADLGAVSPGTPSYDYQPGGYANSITLDMRLADLIRMKASYTCQTTPVPTTSRKSGASTPVLPLFPGAFGAAANILNLRMTTPSLSSTYFHNLSIALTNNVNAEKVLGTLGPLFMGLGILGVSITGEALFTDPTIITAIIQAQTVTADTLLKNTEGGVMIDLPSLTLGGGRRGFPLDKTITIALTGQAFLDPTQPYGTSLSMSFFPVLP